MMPTAASDSASTDLDDASLRKLREQLSTNAISLTHKGLSALPTVVSSLTIPYLLAHHRMSVSSLVRSASARAHFALSSCEGARALPAC
jgi:hypothetical protein